MRPLPHPSSPRATAPAGSPNRDRTLLRPTHRSGWRVSRLDRITLQLGVAVAVVIALCSYAVSATSLYALGVQASWWQAAAVPVVADGPAIYGMFRIVSRSRRGAKGAGYGWLLVTCGTAGVDRRQRRPRPAQPGRPSHRRRHPPRRPGHAGRPQRRRRWSPAWPLRPPTGTARRAGQARPARKHHRPAYRRRQPGHRSGGFGAQRRALPAGTRRSDPTTVGARLQAAYAQPRPDGQAWTARTLAEAAGCGRSSAASFLQRQRPPAKEDTT